MRLLFTSIATTVAAIALLAPTPAFAAHDTPLYVATCEYREAVRDFERAVLRSPDFDRYQERVVDRLEDTTSRLRSAARRPEHVERLLSEWNQIQSLQQLVEQTIFASTRFCPIGGEIVIAWERVICAFTGVAEQISAIQCAYPHYPAQPAYRVPSFGQPPSYGQPSYGQPSYGQPSFGQPSFGQPSFGQPSFGQPNLGQPNAAPNVQDQYGPLGNWNRDRAFDDRGSVSFSHSDGSRDRDGYRSVPAPAPNVVSRYQQPIPTRGGMTAARIGALLSRLVD